jgi:hypothetical protein
MANTRSSATALPRGAGSVPSGRPAGQGLPVILGSRSSRDWLDFVDILVVPFVVLVLGLLWPTIGRFWRRRRFSWLVLRELAEISPHPRTRRSGQGSWGDHFKKRMLHRDLLKEPEVVLSISPSLAYHVAQLWDALEQENDKEWHYHLYGLRRLLGRSLSWRRQLLADFDEARWRWGLLHEEYELGEAADRRELRDIDVAIRRRAAGAQ